MEVLPENGLVTAIDGAVAASDSTLTIPLLDSAIWPASGTYRAVLWQDPLSGPWELVKIVGGQGTAVLTVERAAEPYHGTQVARDWPDGTGIAAVITQDGVYELLAGHQLTMVDEEFLPASGLTTVTLLNTPETLILVARGGVVQSITAGHYSLSGGVLTFSAAFTGSERVVVSYSVRGAVNHGRNLSGAAAGVGVAIGNLAPIMRILSHTSRAVPGGSTGTGTTSAIDTSGADLILVAATGFAFAGGGPMVTLSDSKGNSWTPSGGTIEGSGSGRNNSVQLWYSKPTSVGTGHTFNITAAGDWYGCFAVAASSGSNIAPFDVGNGNWAGPGTTTCSTGAITPSANNELILAAWAIDDPVNTGTPKFSVDSGFAIQEQIDVSPGSCFGLVMATLVQAHASAINPILTRSNARSTGRYDAAHIASFKAVP